MSAIRENLETGSPEKEPGKMGLLQLLNGLKINPVAKPTSKGLMYFEARINNKPTRVIVDTGGHITSWPYMRL